MGSSFSASYYLVEQPAPVCCPVGSIKQATCGSSQVARNSKRQQVAAIAGHDLHKKTTPAASTTGDSASGGASSPPPPPLGQRMFAPPSASRIVRNDEGPTSKTTMLGHAHLNSAAGRSSLSGGGSGSSSDARSSCSDESASLKLPTRNCSADNRKREQRARKRRLQQQRTRKRRSQLQLDCAAQAQAAAASSGSSSSSTHASKQKNKDNASKTSQQQQQQQQTQQRQPHQQRESGIFVGQNDDERILSSSTEQQKSWQSASAGSLRVLLAKAAAANGCTGTSFVQSASERPANCCRSQQRILNASSAAVADETQQSNNNNNTTTTTTTSAHADAKSDFQPKQQTLLSSEKEEDQQSANMSIGGNRQLSSSKKSDSSSSKRLEIEAAAAAEWKQRTASSRRLEPQTTKTNQQQAAAAPPSSLTTASCANYYANNHSSSSSPHPAGQVENSSASSSSSSSTSSASIIDRLIIPAANLNLNQCQQQHYQYQYCPNYIEQQLVANFCCCWERDPNNRDFCAGQLSHLPHYHEVSQPPRRPWIETQRWTPQQQSCSSTSRNQSYYATTATDDVGREFSVLSYNVLCDRMAKPHFFPSTPYSALTWTYRRTKILDQLREYNADIVALQELEWEHFDSFFKPKLAALHYEGIFEPKSRYKTMISENMIRRVDGCAIFYKQNKFHLVKKHLLELKKIAIDNANGNHPMINRVMTKDNIGLVAILELLPPSTSTEQRRHQIGGKKQRSKRIADDRKRQQQQQHQRQHILVCNTHIHWDPKDCDVKLIQTIMLMDELGSIARQHNRDRSEEAAAADATIDYTSPSVSPAFLSDEDEQLMPLILLGDFNSMPSSGVTDYLINGEISSLHKDFKDYRYSAIGSGINHLRRQSSPAWCNYTAAAATNHPSSSPKHNLSQPTTPTIIKTSSTPSSVEETLLLVAQPQSAKHLTLAPSVSLFPALSPVDPSATILSSSPSTSTSSVDSACYSTSSSPAPVLNYSHLFNLTSAYENTVPFTNYTHQFKAVIDYIFYSNDSLQLLGLLGPLDKNWLRTNRIRTLPQPHVPSDHLPLLVRFRLSENTSNHQNPTTNLSPVVAALMNSTRFNMSGDTNETTSLPLQLLSLSNRNRQQPQLEQQHQLQHRPVSSMRYNGTLHVSRPSRRHEFSNSASCSGAPVGSNLNHNQRHQQQQPQRQPKSKWTNQHSRLTRTTSYSPSNKFDQN